MNGAMLTLVNLVKLQLIHFLVLDSRHVRGMTLELLRRLLSGRGQQSVTPTLEPVPA